MEEQQQQSNTVSIQVPPNAAPGDVLTFVVNGQELELTLPEGSAPNDVLEIQVASLREDNDDFHPEQDGPTTISLESNGKSLVLHRFVPNETSESTHPQDRVGDCDGTFSMPWPAGMELVRYLDGGNFQKALEESPFPSRILELGSGMGLVGLCFASTCCLKSPPTKIVLSDCPSAISLLQYNVTQNQDVIPSNVAVSTKVLLWEDGPDTGIEPFDMILGSDLLYNVSHIPQLVTTIQRYSHPTRGKVLIAIRWRKPDLERSFFERLVEQNFDWTHLKGCPLSWDEYGKPSSQNSNRYFRQTMVSVQGRPKSLADIVESDVERMTEKEHEAWETAQIQIYMGVRKKQPLATLSTRQL